MQKRHRLITRADSVLEIEETASGTYMLHVLEAEKAPELEGKSFDIEMPDPWPPRLLDRLTIMGELPEGGGMLVTSQIIDIEVTFPRVVLETPND